MKSLVVFMVLMPVRPSIGFKRSRNAYVVKIEHFRDKCCSPLQRYALVDPAEANDKQVTMSQVSLRARITLDDPSKIGKYTCMAQDAAGNSGAAILTMQESSGYYPDYRPIAPSRKFFRSLLCCKIDTNIAFHSGWWKRIFAHRRTRYGRWRLC